MKKLRILWNVFCAWARTEIARYEAAERDKAQAEELRRQMSDVITQGEADKKKFQDGCRHHIPGSGFLTNAIIPFGEPGLSSRQENAICQHCQKVWFRPDDPILFDKLVADYRLYASASAAGRRLTPEEKRLYDMPLDELKELANA